MRETQTETVTRKVRQERVAGAGGRLRTVWLCEGKCWHNSYKQANACKYGQALYEEAKIRGRYL